MIVRVEAHLQYILAFSFFNNFFSALYYLSFYSSYEVRKGKKICSNALSANTYHAYFSLNFRRSYFNWFLLFPYFHSHNFFTLFGHYLIFTHFFEHFISVVDTYHTMLSEKYTKFLFQYWAALYVECISISNVCCIWNMHETKIEVFYRKFYKSLTHTHTHALTLEGSLPQACFTIKYYNIVCCCWRHLIRKRNDRLPELYRNRMNLAIVWNWIKSHFNFFPLKNIQEKWNIVSWVFFFWFVYIEWNHVFHIYFHYSRVIANKNDFELYCYQYNLIIFRIFLL